MICSRQPLLESKPPIFAIAAMLQRRNKIAHLGASHAVFSPASRGELEPFGSQSSAEAARRGKKSVSKQDNELGEVCRPGYPRTARSRAGMVSRARPQRLVSGTAAIMVQRTRALAKWHGFSPVRSLRREPPPARPFRPHAARSSLKSLSASQERSLLVFSRKCRCTCNGPIYCQVRIVPRYAPLQFRHVIVGGLVKEVGRF
jgi:hypothetical protein